MNRRFKTTGLLLVVSMLFPAHLGLATPSVSNASLQKENKRKKKGKDRGWFCGTSYILRTVNAEGEIVSQTTSEVIVGEAVRKAEPGYPTQAVIERVEGVVVIEAIVSQTGEITSIKAATGPPALITASAEAAKKWRFSPTTINGTPVEALAMITFRYDLGLDGKPQNDSSKVEQSRKYK